MIVSIIIPAYKASTTIGTTLESIFSAKRPDDFDLEVVISDDGSPDGATLADIVCDYDVIYIRHDTNQGKCAALNLGIARTRGDIVILLDADDTLVADWPTVLSTIVQTWPSDAPICFSMCRTTTGELTASDPSYRGTHTFKDMLNDRHMGEYLPMFRGDVLRAAGGYRDPGMLYSCEMWTYLSFAETSDLWISDQILRIYHANRPGSVSASIFTPMMAERMVRCYDLIFADFEEAYRIHAPEHLGRRRLRQAVFAAMAGQRPRAWSVWKSGARWKAPVETLMALLLILLGPGAAKNVIVLAKRLRLTRRYG